MTSVYSGDDRDILSSIVNSNESRAANWTSHWDDSRIGKAVDKHVSKALASDDVNYHYHENGVYLSDF